MKIAYVLVDTHQQSGATKSFLTLLKGVMNKGIEPLLIVPDRKDIYHDLLAMGVEVQVLNYRPAVYPWLFRPIDYLKFIPRLIGRIYVNRKAVPQLASILKERHIDIVHTNVSVVDIGFRAASKIGIPHIYHIREYGKLAFDMYSYPSKRSFIKRLQNSSSYSICITKSIQAYYNQQNCERSHVIYNGIFSVQPYKPEHERGSYFLFAGRIEAVKGLDMLIDGYIAYARVTPSLLPLYIAGETINMRLRQNLEKKVSRSGLSDNIHFLGPRKDIEELMKHAYAVIITSSFEAFGRCMPEAMFLGCLTIARNTAGTLEQLENGLRTAGEDIALRFDTTEQLSRQLLKATQLSNAEYDHITKKAWETVTHLYNIETYVNAILSFYHKILKKE